MTYDVVIILFWAFFFLWRVFLDSDEMDKGGKTRRPDRTRNEFNRLPLGEG